MAGLSANVTSYAHALGPIGTVTVAVRILVTAIVTVTVAVADFCNCFDSSGLNLIQAAAWQQHLLLHTPCVLDLLLALKAVHTCICWLAYLAQYMESHARK
jgi:hypothetical protein